MRTQPISRVFFVLYLLLLTSIASFSQKPAPTATPKIADDEGVIKVDSRLVVVPVSVTDANGQPVQGLKVEDFRVNEEGRPQKLDSVLPADAVPLEIALLFDISATTYSLFKFEQDTASQFLKDVMKPNDKATIFTIGAKATLVQPRDTAERSIASIQTIAPTKEYTAFYDSVAAAAEYLKANAPETSRRVVVVISDGDDTNSTRIAEAIQKGYKQVGEKINTMDNKTLLQLTTASRNEASVAERARISKELQDADTVFYSINPTGSGIELSKNGMFGQANMQAFATQTGGTAFLPKFGQTDTKDTLANDSNVRKNQAALDQIFKQIASELRAQYLVQYYPETEYAPGKFVKLDVGLAHPTGRKVRAREGYYFKK